MVVEDVGVSMPVMEGRGAAVPDVVGTTTRSERQIPRPEMVLEAPLQFAEEQVPPRRTWLELEHARQLLGPEPEQLEQVESQDLHVDDVLSKYCPLLQVGRQRPFVSTGRSEGQLEHWLNELPEHDAQSGWQAIHWPEELNVLEGHDDTHEPFDASWLFAQVKQKVDEPAQVLHDESQAERNSCQVLSAT